MNILRLKQQAQGWHCRCNDAPDMTAMNTNAAAQAALSKEQLDWAKQVYAEGAPERATTTAKANAISDAQLTAMSKQTALTDEYAAYNKGTFQPLEKGIVAAAQAYDTPERRQAEADKAQAGVEMQLAGQRAATARNMQSSGVNPNSYKMMAMQGTMDLGAAKIKAGADAAARTQVETIGHAQQMDAANLGRGLASNQATSAGIALNQGNAAVGNAQVGGNVNAQSAALMNSGFAGAQGGLSGAANTYGNIARMGQQDSGLFGALGGVAGQFAGSKAGSTALAGLLPFSDVNMKTNITPTDPEEALEAVEQTPVSNWAYKAGTAPDDGGQAHTGPMAQDVQKNMGEKAGPKGKKIDLVAMNGITMAAIQGLSQKVNRLMAAQGVPQAA